MFFFILNITLFCHSAGITKTASKLSLKSELRQKAASLPVKPAAAAVSTYSSNGQIHSQYHGYFVNADTKFPLPDEPVGMDDGLHPSSLAHLPSPVKAPNFLPVSCPLPVHPKESITAPDPPKSRRQESIKPKCLAETKKASVEIVPEIIEEEMVS